MEAISFRSHKDISEILESVENCFNHRGLTSGLQLEPIGLHIGMDLEAVMQQPAMPVKHSKASGAGGSIVDILEVI